MAAIHPFHCVVAATVRHAPTSVAEPPPLAPWLRYLCGRAVAAPGSSDTTESRRIDGRVDGGANA